MRTNHPTTRFSSSGRVTPLVKALLLAPVFSLAAFDAALAIEVPAAVDASQVDRRFRETPTPLDRTEMNLPLPGQSDELSQAMQDKLSKHQFVLKSVEIKGASAFSADALAFAYEGMVGKKISLLDAHIIARKITAHYHKEGYILSQAVVPQQEIKNGVLVIQVVEGFIGSVLIQGELSDSERNQIAKLAANITKARPARSQDIEHYILLINDLPGANVKGLLRPSPGIFGSADLVLTMENNKPFEGSYSVDNRGSEYIGPWQHSFIGIANSLFGLYDRTQLRFTTSSPTTELRSFEIQHEELLGSQGTKLTLLASHTRTEPGDALTSVEIVGDSRRYEAKLSHPFLRSRRENLSGYALFDYHNSDTDVFRNVKFTQDRLRVARAGGSYNFFDSLQANNFIDAEFSKGLDVFNATEHGTNRTNALGESDFRKFNLDLSRLQPLPENFSLLASASGQYSLDPLLVSEQFSLGGTAFGGAYDPAELLGDHGIGAKLELRYTGLVSERYFNSYQLFGYYDIGRTWVREGGAGANDKRSLASVGGGVRASFTEMLSSTLEVGVPLTKPASNQGSHEYAPRLFFGTTARF